MAGELRMKQFVNEEVKPALRDTLPDILDRLASLESTVERLKKRLESNMKPKRK